MNTQFDASLIINGNSGKQAIMDSIGGGDNKPTKQFESVKTVFITPDQHRERLEAMEMYRGMQKQRTANGKYPVSILNKDGSATSLDYQLLDVTKEMGYIIEYYPNREAKETKDTKSLLTCYIFDSDYMKQLKRFTVTAEERKGRYPAYEKNGMQVEVDVYLLASLEEMVGEDVIKLKKKCKLIRGEFFDDMNLSKK